ncbi:MAG TPA: hypothetical protein VLJ39_15835 [Tepidisphaeraceae bacterium]|nr:hypothetical protein [Tepidisphaeraceae bacterium]
MRIRVGVCFAFTLSVFLAPALAAPAPSHGSSSSKGKSAPAEEVIPNAWPKLTEEEQSQALDALKKFAGEAQTTLGSPLKMYETKYFVFYTDLGAKEAQNWSGLLDRMYARMAEIFAVPKGENIWAGKALVFVFQKKKDYQKYEQEVMHTDPGTSAGMCHSNSNGIVRIAFYRQPEELEFAHVLVHESVHGFIHRYRTPVPVPSWANEGLAETIATELVPQRGRRDQVKSQAREGLQEHGSRLGSFFTEDHIVGWQYPVAEMLCTFMIQSSKKNYVDFIKGIKNGDKWDDSLANDYKASVDRLVPAFGQSLGIKNLQP